MPYSYLHMFPQADVLPKVSSIHNPKKCLAFVIAVGCIEPFVVYCT